jgi:hypothetical protein
MTTGSSNTFSNTRHPIVELLLDFIHPIVELLGFKPSDCPPKPLHLIFQKQNDGGNLFKGNVTKKGFTDLYSLRFDWNETTGFTIPGKVSDRLGGAVTLIFGSRAFEAYREVVRNEGSWLSELNPGGACGYSVLEEHSV